MTNLWASDMILRRKKIGEKEREMRARKDSSYKSTYVSKFSSLKLMQLLKLQSNFPA